MDKRGIFLGFEAAAEKFVRYSGKRASQKEDQRYEIPKIHTATI